MQPAPYAPDETGRLIALKDLGLSDTPPERRFDRVVQIAARLTASPIGIMSLVGETRVTFKSVTGARAAGVSLGEPFREYWFCSHVVGTGSPVTVRDARVDPRFDRLPCVIAETPVLAYAGVPIRAPRGEHIGALAVLSLEVREYSDAEIAVLAELARLIEAELSSLPHMTVDGLSGALNSRTFSRLGGRLLELADSRGTPSAVLRVDLKGTGAINTEFGFGEGDQALVDTAQLLGSTVRGSDLVGRVGPDEFAVLLVGADSSSADIVVERLRTTIREHNATAGRRYHLDYEIGLAEHRVGEVSDLPAMLTAAALSGELGL